MSEFQKRDSYNKSPDYYYPTKSNLKETRQMNGGGTTTTTNAISSSKSNNKPTTIMTTLTTTTTVVNNNNINKSAKSSNSKYPYTANNNNNNNNNNEDDYYEVNKSSRRSLSPKPMHSNKSDTSTRQQLSPDSLEMERLKAQINQEEQLRQAVEQSYNELLSTSKELEKRMNMIDEEIQSYDQIKEVKYNNKKPPLIMYEGNEWKTRFENQEEINRQLTKQIGLLEAKLEDTKHRIKLIKGRGIIDNKHETTPEFIDDLEKAKQSLIAQLRDYEWRLEQENKAYHKANEERKDLHQEILDIRNQMNLIKESNLLTARMAAQQREHLSKSQTNTHTTHHLPPLYTSLSVNRLDAINDNSHHYPTTSNPMFHSTTNLNTTTAPTAANNNNNNNSSRFNYYANDNCNHNHLPEKYPTISTTSTTTKPKLRRGYTNTYSFTFKKNKYSKSLQKLN